MNRWKFPKIQEPRVAWVRRVMHARTPAKKTRLGPRLPFCFGGGGIGLDVEDKKRNEGCSDARLLFLWGGNDRDSLSGSVSGFRHFLGGKSMLVVNAKCCQAHPIRKRGEAREGNRC